MSEPLHEGLFERIPVGVYRTSVDGTLLDANPALVRMLGYPDRATLLSVSIPTLYVDPADRLRGRSVVAESGVLSGFPTQVYRHDGSTIWVRHSSRATHDESGALVSYEGVLEDITDERRAEAHARELEELARARLETLLVEAQLDSLRMQLNPHFLFNTLHAVSGLMDEDVAAARRMLTRLGEMLRLTLRGDDAHETRLSNEVQTLELYLEIQRERFRGLLSVQYDTPADTLACFVPQMILQPLVENAIEHGLTARGGGQVRIIARRVGTQLRISVENNGSLEGRSRRGDGIGLRNTRARLERLYGDAQSLELVDADGRVTATIEVPARVEMSTGAVASREPNISGGTRGNG